MPKIVVVKIEPELIEDMQVDVSSIKTEALDISEDFFEEDLVVDEEESLENPDPIQAESSSSFTSREFSCPFCSKEFQRNGPLQTHIQNKHLLKGFFNFIICFKDLPQVLGFIHTVIITNHESLFIIKCIFSIDWLIFWTLIYL